MSISSFQAAYPADTQKMEVIVKWFNPEKGFGFVSPSDPQEGEDIFLHLSALRTMGRDQVQEGDILVCQIGPGKKGRQVVQVLEIRPGEPSSGNSKASSNQSFSNSSFSRRQPRRAPSPSREGTETLTGIVKWFNPHKGFGFVSPEEGGADVFVHASLLHSTGVRTLEPDQKIRMQVTDSARGREAIEIELVD